MGYWLKKEKALKSVYTSFILTIVLVLIGKNELMPQINKQVDLAHTSEVEVWLHKYPHISIQHQNESYHAECFDALCVDYFSGKKLEGRDIKFLIIRYGNNPKGIILGGNFYDAYNKKTITFNNAKMNVERSLKHDFYFMMILRVLLICGIIYCIVHIWIFFRSKS